MPLVKIPNQPYFKDPNNPTVEFCEGDYCHIVRADDPIYVQWYQTSCGINEACDPDFTDVTFGADLFPTLCSDPDISFTDASWTCGAVPTEPTFTKTTSTAAEQVQVANFGMTQYKMYKITFTIASRVSGFINIILGGAGTQTYSGWFGENGTYTVYQLYLSAATDQFAIESSGSTPVFGIPHSGDPFVGTVQDIEVEEISFGCWDTGSGTWEISGLGGACKLVLGTTGDLKDDVGGNYLTGNTYYQLDVVVSDYTSGTLTPNIGDHVGAIISGNGTHKIYGTPTVAGFITLTPSSDFIGCVDSIDVRELKDDYTAELVSNNVIGEIVIDVSSYVTYFNEWVTLCVTPQEVGALEHCWNVALYDLCDLQYGPFEYNGTLTGGGAPNLWTPPPNWTRLVGSDNQFDYSLSRVAMTWTSAPNSGTISVMNDPNLNFVDGNYRIKFTVVSNTDTTNIGAYVFIFDQDTPFVIETTAGAKQYDVVYTQSVDNIQSFRVIFAAEFDVTGSGTDTAGTIIIDNIIVTRLAPYDATFESECITITDPTQTGKSKLFIGSSDKNMFGFEFENTPFKLLQRLECRALNPSWNIDKDSYTRSTGTKSLNYAEVAKNFEMFIEAAPATVHGALAIQMNCDTFEIGDTENDTKVYIVADGDLTPEWDRQGASDIAPVRISLRISEQGTLFNREC